MAASAFKPWQIDLGFSMSKRLRFRFSLRTLLFGTVVLAAGMAWWVSWPQRRATQLINAMVSSPEEAEALSGGSGMWTVLREYQHGHPYLEAHSRSVSDVILGRQVFTVVLPTHEKQGNGTLDFTGTLFVTRGEMRGPIELNSLARRWEY